MMPTSVTLPKSCPLTIIWVPTRISASPAPKASSLLPALFPLRGISVHPENPSPGKCRSRHLLKFLCPGAEAGKIRGTADGAAVRQAHLVAAVMAYQPVSPMEGQGDVAVWAADGSPAGPAGDKIGKSPPVDEKHDLLSPPEPVLHRLTEHPAEDRPVAEGKFRRMSTIPAFGRMLPAAARRVSLSTVFAGERPAVDSRMGSPSRARAAPARRALSSGLPRVVARRLLALIGGFTCSSSMMIRPRFRNGANRADLGPIMIWTSPRSAISPRARPVIEPAKFGAEQPSMP